MQFLITTKIHRKYFVAFLTINHYYPVEAGRWIFDKEKYVVNNVDDIRKLIIVCSVLYTREGLYEILYIKEKKRKK